MSEPTPPPASPRRITPIQISTEPANDKVSSDRCGADIYRMHAVWRCTSRGFKTDCCGW